VLFLIKNTENKNVYQAAYLSKLLFAPSQPPLLIYIVSQKNLFVYQHL